MLCSLKAILIITHTHTHTHDVGWIWSRQISGARIFSKIGSKHVQSSRTYFIQNPISHNPDKLMCGTPHRYFQRRKCSPWGRGDIGTYFALQLKIGGGEGGHILLPSILRLLQNVKNSIPSPSGSSLNITKAIANEHGLQLFLFRYKAKPWWGLMGNI